MGLGICCKPDSTDEHCGDTNTKHVCSSPSYDELPDKYTEVLTGNRRNYQMFAFCPSIDQRICGISQFPLNDHRLNATEFEKSLYSDKMRYIEGNQREREYDSCYYEINKGPEVDDEILDTIKSRDINGEVSLYIKFLKKTEMNVYIYGGKDRFSATENIIEENSQPMINVPYKVDIDTGILVIAYPNKDEKDTEL